jgi:hypothetical protein
MFGYRNRTTRHWDAWRASPVWCFGWGNPPVVARLRTATEVTDAEERATGSIAALRSGKLENRCAWVRFV